MDIPEWSEKMEPGDRVEYKKPNTPSPSPSLHPTAVGFGEATDAATDEQLGVPNRIEISARTGKPKRRKALRACGNCQRTHLTCDDNRPCERCIKRGCADTCTDGVRKKVKYLEKSSRNHAMGRKGSLSSSVAPPIHGDGNHYYFDSMNRGPITIDPADVPALTALSQRVRVPIVSPHDHVQQHHVEQPETTMLPQDILEQQQTQEFAVNCITVIPDSAAPDPQVSDPSMASQHPVGPMAPTPLQELPQEDASNSNYTTTAADPALAAPSHGPSAFHSFAADSEYTVVARMLENSRPKSDQDYSPPDSGKFTSSNVDLRNFVTSQPPAQESGQTPDNQGYSSWLDPPPPPPPAVVVQRRKSGMPNVKRVDSDGSDHSVGVALPHPSDVYHSVREPYPYTPAFHGLLTFLKQRFNREKLMRIVRSMARIRPSFIAVTKDLTHEDLVFMEQCFQRSLLEYEKYFAYSGTPSVVWRRSGQIAAVAPEFCMLTQWPRHELRSRFIVEVMSDESAVDYFERFSEMTFTDTRGQIMYDCFLLTPMGQQIRTSAVLTVRKDMFGIPMTIIGNFLPHV